MTKQFKSVSMMLFLLAMSAGPAFATTGNAPMDAPVVQQGESLRAQLDSTMVVNPDGTSYRLREKKK